MSTQLGETLPRENSGTGDGAKSLLTVATVPDGSGNSIIIQMDATAKRLLIRKVNASGVQVTGSAEIIADLDDLTGTNKEAYFQLF
ncbi:MAG: hypothetical protein JWR69_1177, partial [Pedosphaera sp.]|nr:hypothetical protein [Pedosphaera sp.]